ncbi:MAG: hydrogenase/urease maturation nickel metallochaperone HypA [Gemmatimonadales bacterium]|jgi:Zn finger protein HypA/HybF involved in hydrogenase expression
MHEMSVAMEVCRIVESRVPREAVGRVVTVGIDVGDESGVEPDSLQFWLESLLASPPFDSAKPAITRVSGNVLRVSYLEVQEGGFEASGT